MKSYYIEILTQALIIIFITSQFMLKKFFTNTLSGILKEIQGAN